MSLAFVFPGQGSQSVGMLQALAEQHDEVRATFAEAGNALASDLWTVVSQGPEEQLNQTVTTQPAMLAAGVAVWRVWKKSGGPDPVVMAGHSLGEYTALVCAGALDFIEAVTLVADRARFMQAAVPVGQGAMAAIIGMDDEAVNNLCKAHAGDQVLSAVNFNSPGQVVIAGNSEAVQRAVAHAKDAGAKRALVLPVSVPSHCSLMQAAAEQMSERLQTTPIAPPKIPVIHNSNVKSASDAEAIKQALVAQTRSPVRWVETIATMAGNGIDLAIESGPGKVLMGLNKRIDKRVKTMAIYDDTTLQQGLKQATGH